MSMSRSIALVWGLGGVVAILLGAVARLTPRAISAFSEPLGAGHYAFAAFWLVFMLYTEGYRGFQKRFSPTCVGRAFWLADNPSLLRLLLAPLFCMGFFHGTRKRLITSWALTSGVVLIVLVVHRLPQPARGLIDLGVVAGLTYGVATVLALIPTGGGDPMVPDSAAPSAVPDAP